MPDTTRVLAFAGSSRRDSFNRRILKLAIEGAIAQGAEVTEVDLGELEMPIYNGDDEARDGIPAGAMRLKELLKSHHALIVACPEYNGSITPLLKNAIDWASRPVPDEAPLACFTGKVAAIVAASPGALGGLRGLRHVREILSGIGVLVIPDQPALPRAHEELLPDGTTKDPATAARLRAVGARVAEVASRLL